MNRGKDLSYFIRLKYNVILRNRNNLFYLFIPELSIIVESEDLGEAYKKLEIEKEAYFKNAIDLDAVDTIAEPAHLKLRKTLTADFLPFLVKLFIIAFMVFVVSLPIAGFVSYQLNRMPGFMIRFVWHLPGRINDRLKNMSVEKKEEKLLEWRGAVKQAKPFIDEVRVLFKDNPEKGPKNLVEETK